jgi:hypothetical protein
VFFYEAKLAHEQQHPIWLYLVAGTVFIGASVLSWVKSLEREVDNNKGPK